MRSVRAPHSIGGVTTMALTEISPAGTSPPQTACTISVGLEIDPSELPGKNLRAVRASLAILAMTASGLSFMVSAVGMGCEAGKTSA